MDDKILITQLIETWQTNNRINLFLIGKIDTAGMKSSLSKRGGRSVTRQFAHLHNNRVWQLERRAKDLAKGLHKFETTDEPDKRTLKKHLNQSAKRFETYWTDAVTGDVKRACFKKGVIAYLAYFIAHEAHHRGNILLTLKESGHNLDQDTKYAVWNWDKI